MISKAVIGITKQMLDGAVLTLTDKGRAGEDDGEHGDVVDDLGHADEPGSGEVGIEGESCFQLHRQRGLAVGGKGSDLFGQDSVDVAIANTGLRHGGRIDVDLECRLTSGKKVGLEARRDDHDE